MDFMKCMMRVCLPILSVLGFAFFIFIANWKPDFLKNKFDNFVDNVQIEKTESEKEAYTRSKEPSAFE
jgi:hypothetical protein